MTLAELGAKLREAREARGMSVADVADRLKIPGRILQGVEDASERLPRTVYVHHFIKDYIKLMGFSAAEAAEWTNSYICISILYWCFSLWLTSLCIIGSSFIHLIRTDSNVFFLMAE